MKITFVGTVILLCFVVSIVFCILGWIMIVKNNKMASYVQSNGRTLMVIGYIYAVS